VSTIKTVSFDDANYSFLIEETQNKRGMFSSILNDIIADFRKKKDIANIKIIECGKCGAKYSERLGSCPNCENTRISDYNTYQELKAKERAEVEKCEKEIQLKTAKIDDLQDQKRRIINFLTDSVVERPEEIKAPYREKLKDIEQQLTDLMSEPNET
jgi:hypothetical protein